MPLTAGQWAQRIAEWFPGLDAPGARASTWPLIEPHHERIKDWLDANVTVATIAQRLRDHHGVEASESSVRRWIATHFAEEVARARVTVLRGEVPPGSEPQIDYVRHLRTLDGGQPLRVFETFEAEALKPLPRTAFELTTWSTAPSGPTRTSRWARPSTACRGG